MKKNLFYLFAIVFMAVGVTACSSSDDDKEKPLPELTKIVGEWAPEQNIVMFTPMRKEGVSDDDYSISGGIFTEPYPLEDAMQMGSGLASEKLAPMLKAIEFKQSLEIVAAYFDIDEEGAIHGDVKFSPEGLMTYKFNESNNSMVITPNAKNIIAKMKEDKTGNEEVYALINKYLVGSFKAECVFSNKDNTKELVAIQLEVLPLVKENFEMISSTITNLLPPVLKPIVDPILSQIPTLLENTQSFKVSLNLNRVG